MAFNNASQVCLVSNSNLQTTMSLFCHKAIPPDCRSVLCPRLVLASFVKLALNSATTGKRVIVACWATTGLVEVIRWPSVY